LKKLYLIMRILLVLVCFSGVLIVSYATEEIKIGLIYPLTGKIALSGKELAQGIELAVEIVNNKFEGIDLPLAATEGLPNLGGAKITLIKADHEGSPEKALSGAERLISLDHVIAMLGAYTSACTATASQATERNQIPFLCCDGTSPSLTERGFKWFFRTGPHDELFIEGFFKFFDNLKKEKGIEIKTIATLYEDTLFGADVARVVDEKAEKYGYEVIKKVTFATGTSELNSEVQQLKASEPDALILASYVSDQIIFMRTAKELDFNVGGMLNTSGWVDNSVILPNLKEDADFVISRADWSLDLAGEKPVVGTVNKLYKEIYGENMNAEVCRTFTGAYALFMAINNAGSTENVAIQKALQNLDIPGDQIIMPWPGIKLDEKGQNQLVVPLMVQVKDQEFHTVWPFEMSSMEIVWPMTKWSER